MDLRVLNNPEFRPNPLAYVCTELDFFLVGDLELLELRRHAVDLSLESAKLGGCCLATEKQDGGKNQNSVAHFPSMRDEIKKKTLVSGALRFACRRLFLA
jgi:hypothetical protein